MEPVLEAEIRRIIRDERAKERAEESQARKDLREQPYKGAA